MELDSDEREEFPDDRKGLQDAGLEKNPVSSKKRGTKVGRDMRGKRFPDIRKRK